MINNSCTSLGNFDAICACFKSTLSELTNFILSKALIHNAQGIDIFHVYCMEQLNKLVEIFHLH